MVRVVAILAGIFLAAYLAVHLGYARLEKELLGRSFCGIAELGAPEPGKQGEEEGKTSQLTSASTSTNSEGNDPKEKDSPSRGAGSVSPDQLVNKENLNFQVIIHRNIFQLVQEEQQIAIDQQPVTIQEATPEAPPTTLNLTLLGTILGDDQTSRAIIIEEKQNEQKLYQIGDAVQGAIIQSIERGKVILEVFGAQETLMMKKREGGGGAGPSLPSLRRRVSPPQRQPPPELMENDLEEVDEDELTEEKKMQASRRPPSIRPHRRINFRRNPIRNSNVPDIEAEEEDREEDIVEEEQTPALEEELPPLD
ncbi:MAG: hypothetical protein D3917_04350 [Candidatus Electrothrix sp. AX5]|nr:hypothetical protein [Candidatus Electrothrix sp. AX5]